MDHSKGRRPAPGTRQSTGKLIFDPHHSKPRPPRAAPTSSIHIGLNRVASVIAAATIVTATARQLVSAARAITVPLAMTSPERPEPGRDARSVAPRQRVQIPTKSPADSEIMSPTPLSTGVAVAVVSLLRR
jgi:hypothetical protein